MTDRRHLNLTAAAWRQIRRKWRPPLTLRLLLQSYLAGPLFSAMHRLQDVLASIPTDSPLAAPVFVLGYWRSGTTLLHNYLCCDKRYGYPSTYACMNPHHFALTQRSALAVQQPSVKRPMDRVEVAPSSPQEDEFALLGLGARSPYEALLAPRSLADALALGDPRDLTPVELARWRSVFVEFLKKVSAVENGRPLILKSPPHGYRVATLRELFPQGRFVLIVRAPERVFESSVRMWRQLFDLYSLEAVPPPEQIREVVLTDRLRFEAKLEAGLAGLRADQVTLVRYEDLVQKPLTVLREVYDQLQLGDFTVVEPAIEAQLHKVGQYAPLDAAPPSDWTMKVRDAWAPIFRRYGYEPL